MMSHSDVYTTLWAPTVGEYKEKGSKFLAFAYPLDGEGQVAEIIERLRHAHIKARHYCYAYRIGTDGNRFRANDDGEPSGTAGKPIMAQIQSHGLTNVIVVVVRYFGGIKLGAGGLAQAYKEAAREALCRAETVVRYVSDDFMVAFGYDQMGHILSVIKEMPEVSITDKSFEKECWVTISIRRSLSPTVLLTLKARILQVTTEQAADIKEIPGVTITGIH